MWVLVGVVQAILVMQVGARGEAALADIGDHFALRDPLARA